MNESDNLFIPLQLTPGVHGVYLRNLRGADEMKVENADTKNLLNFLETLMQPYAEENKVNAAQIVTADRDRLLASLYISMYGAKIESTVNCVACGQKLDLDFLLDELLIHYEPDVAAVKDNGNYQLEPGISFRLPNGEDEMFINRFKGAEAERELLQRCIKEGNAETDNEKVQLKMAELAPVLNMQMQVICPECGNEQQVQFDMQSFFLTKLKQERSELLKEIHCIASKYHWSQQEILNLPRNLRKQYAALIQQSN
jgi:ribosomal protein S27E